MKVIVMSAQLEQARKALKELSADEKELLYFEFLEDMEKIDPEIEKAWLDEAERRLNDIKSGKVKTIPAEKVFADARRMLNERRGISSSGKS